MAIYPPIIQSAMPAFPYTNGIVRIYFAIPALDSKSELKRAHVTVKYVNNNINALKTYYKAKIKTTSIKEVLTAEDSAIASTSYRYYVELKSDDLEKGFVSGITYKIQIRFDTVVLDPGEAPEVSYFSSNTTKFSEWSTVCLIRPIIEPRISIEGFPDENDANSTVQITRGSIDGDFIGKYDSGDSEETLKKWKFTLYDEDKDSILADSDWNTFNSYDYSKTENNGIVSIEENLKYEMDSNSKYNITFSIQTKNNYTKSINYKFTAVQYGIRGLNDNETDSPATLTATSDNDNGIIKVVLASSEIDIGNLTMRRTSSLSNYKIWEDVGNKVIAEEKVSWSFKDFTVEPGVFYKYGVQWRDNRGRRGTLLKTEDAVMVKPEYALLLGPNQQQLKLSCNFNISSYQQTVSESKTDTLGSRYPFIRRNGNTYYRTFPATGLITYDMNSNIDSNYFNFNDSIGERDLTISFEDYFTSKDKLYNGYTSLYENSDPVVFNSYNYILEHKFRDAVEKFLYDDNVKLFRSTTEGAMLVKLMNITFTPEETLGRLLYSFSATFVEVDEATLENFDKYNIQNIGTFNPHISFTTTEMGQESSYTGAFKKNTNTDGSTEIDEYGIQNTYVNFAAGQNIIEKINKKYMNKKIDNVVIKDFNLSYLRLTIESSPYLIKLSDNGTLSVATSGNSDENLLLGWLFNIDGKTIIIKYPNTTYEIYENNLVIQSSSTIAPLADTALTLDYIINLHKEEDTSQVPTTIIYKDCITQLNGHYSAGTDIYSQLYYKYYEKVPDVRYRKLRYLYSVEIEADPGTAISITTSGNYEPKTMYIDETALLYINPSLGNNDEYITGLKIVGTQTDPQASVNAIINCVCQIEKDVI